MLDRSTGVVKINLQKPFQRIHKKRLAEATRSSDQQQTAFGLHQRFDETRFINVVAIVPNHVRKIFVADSWLFQHGKFS